MKQKKDIINPQKKGRSTKSGFQATLNLFDRTDQFITKNIIYIAIAILGISLLFAFLLFNAKISEANDDALYIEAAYNFSINFFGYYTAYAPLYPMILSIVVKCLGINLIALKFTSILFMVMHLFFLYKAFNGRVPAFVLLGVIFLAGVNSYFLYFASMTFTEQFFLMLQALFLWLFFNAYNGLQNTNSFLNNFKIWLLPCLTLFILTMTRNLAIAILAPVIVFFIWNKKPMQIVYFLFGFLLFRLPFELFRKLMWGSQNQFSNQLNVLIMQKNPYDPSKGVEDFSGFIDRFSGNFGLYISKRFYQILGFLSESDTLIRPGLGFIFLVLLGMSFVLIIKSKNVYMLFTFLYIVALVCVTFVSLQTSWDQYRFIMVYVPLILIIIFSAFYHMLYNSPSVFQFFLIAAMGLLIFSSLFTSINRSVKNYSIVKRNFSGDIFYGYTPDWSNYLKMSKWCGDSLPETSFVACRKSPMSFIYAGGKEFFPVYTVFSNDPDTVLAEFKKNKVTHIILASLRRNPKKSDGYVINTIHRLLAPVAQKYPQKLQLVKQVGESEAAYLYKFNY